MKPAVLIIIYLTTVTAPLVASWLMGLPPRPLHQELASGLGILAYSMILAEFVLSGRFKAIANRVGMDVTMRFHQMMARTALFFALIHPLFYTAAPVGRPRPWDSSNQLAPTGDISYLATGILAYLLLFALVMLAIGRRDLDYRYEPWRLMHGLGALLIALLLLHHTVYAGRYGAQPAMTWLWLGLTAAAVGSLLFVYLIVPLFERKRTWQVVSVARLTPMQWEVTVTPRGHDGLNYKAGQFAWLNVGHSPFTLKENPFSICSAPANGPDVSFMIKELGDFTRTIGEIAPGTVAYLDGPFGTLTVDDRDEPGVALIAGGVGLAPLLGILRQMRATDDPRDVRLVYGNRAIEQIAWTQELEDEDVVYVLSEPPDDWSGEAGMIDAALLDRTFSQSEFRTWLFVMCGPPAMMTAVEARLIERGTPPHRILTERFDYD